MYKIGNRKPTNYKTLCMFRMTQRDYNDKGYHDQITYITKSENIEECLPFIKKHILVEGTKIMLDGCGIGKSNILNNIYEVDRCNHKKNLYVKPNSIIEDVNNKVHNNYVENSFRRERKKVTDKYGIKSNSNINKSNKNSVERFINESDWYVNYTNKTPNDCLLTLITQISDLWFEISI